VCPNFKFNQDFMLQILEQILEVPLQVEKWLSLINIQKSWPLKGIVPTITSTPLYQTEQGVL
jgi:hypothetical protein